MAEAPKASEAIARDDVVIQTIDPTKPVAEPPVPIEDAAPARPSEIPAEEPAVAVPQPTPAEIVPEPGPGNLPPVTSTIAKQAAEIGLSVENAERDGQQLFLVVEGESVEDVIGADSRRLAYDSRFHYGFDNAGIEPHGGAEPVPGSTKYRQTWKLTRSMI